MNAYFGNLVLMHVVVVQAQEDRGCGYAVRDLGDRFYFGLDVGKKALAGFEVNGMDCNIHETRILPAPYRPLGCD